MSQMQHPNMFTAVEMTDAISKLPIQSTVMSPYFERQGVKSTSVELEIRKGEIILIADQERDATPNDVGRTHKDRQVKFIPTNHLPQIGTIRPEDSQNVRGFGTTDMISPATVVNDKLLSLKKNLEMTLEFHRLGAIKGQVLDVDGDKVLHDCFNIFGATKKNQVIKFPASKGVTDDIAVSINKGVRQLEAGLGGNPYSHVDCICGAEFYDALTQHELVKKIFMEWLIRNSYLGDNDMRKRTFPFAGVNFIECSKIIGGKTQVESTKAHMFPVGPGIFKTYYAPANWEETVNTRGREYYARMDKLDFGRGTRIEVQSNPLTICKFPEALVELSIG